MSDGDLPEAQGAGSKLAVLLERSKNTERLMDTVVKNLGALNDTVNRIERVQIETRENLTARSEANSKAITSLDAKVDHKDQSSIARDAQQVTMLREETAARNAALREQREQHDQDISEIKAEIKSMADKLEDSVFWNRIMAGATVILTLVAGAAITAGVNHLFP